MREVDAFFCQRIQIRRPHIRIAGTAGRLLTPLIARDEDYIGFVVRILLRERPGAAELPVGIR